MKNVISTLICLLVFTGLSASNPPTIVCINGLSANIMPTGEIVLWATDFLQYVEDDETPYNDIAIGMRIAGTGTGFPDAESITFNCEQLGNIEIELWAKDGEGNTSFCQTILILTDAFNTCESDPQVLSAQTLAGNVQALALTPNPAGQASRLNLSSLRPESNWQISISDHAGRVLVSERGNGNSYDLGSKTLAPGMYILRVVDNDGQVYAGKLMVR